MNALRPRNTSLFISSQMRESNSERVKIYGPNKFNSYEDWFFFVHIDPYQRFWHCIGMFIGTFFFFMLFYSWSLWSLIYYPLGVFFFYGLGVLSHRYYDGNSGMSHPRYFYKTTFTVIKINLYTILGLYNRELQRFVKKYPFVLEAFELKEGLK
jgi:hypothetical protein